jgi:ferredoxin
MSRRSVAIVEAHLVVDPISCVGHGLCAELLPELIQLDDWGYPIIDSRAVPQHLMAHVRRAIDSCPTLALHIRSVSNGDATRTS